MEGTSAFVDIRKINASEFYLLAVLCVVNVVNYMDRIGIAAVLVKIQEELQIGDDMAGLLQTLLLVAYTLSAPLFGYFGDRYSRKLITMLCMALWSMSIVVGAFARSYIVLLISRILVGVGQSGFSTITPTVISDVMLRGARTVVLAIFYLGIPLGAGVGYAVVAAVSDITGSWTYGLCVGPILCMIGIVLLLFAKFPNRGEKEALEKGVSVLASTPYKEDIIYLLKVPSFNLVTLGFMQISFFVGALSWWVPKCLYEGFHLIPDGPQIELEDVAFSFGSITVVTGIFGCLIGVTLSRLLRPRYSWADPVICACSLLAALPFVTTALGSIAISRVRAFILIFFSELNMNLNWALCTDMLLYVVIPTRRTSAQGLSMLFSHGFGDCISPYFVGMMSEYLKRNYQFTNGSFFLPIKNRPPFDALTHAQSFHALQMSLFIVALALIIGALAFFTAIVFIEADTEEAQKSLTAR